MTDTLFTFDHKGETYTFEKGFEEIRKPAWLRKHRRRDEVDLTFTILETIAGEAALAAIDDMSEDEFVVVAKRLDAELGASLGK